MTAPTLSDEFKSAAMGAAAGVLAAAVTSLFQSAWVRAKMPTASGPTATPATVTFAGKLCRAVLGRDLLIGETAYAGTLVHLATGAGLGAAYSLLVERDPQVAAGLGIPYGLAVWAVLEETGLAVAGINPPPWQVQSAEHLFSGASHVVFGLSLDAARIAIAGRPLEPVPSSAV